MIKMANTFMIIDDDLGIIKMIEQIIKKNDLGKIVSSLTSGHDAVDEVLFYNPDILLVDYLLPSKDGTEIVEELLDRGYGGKVIMVSQVEDEPMVSKAYKKGILFFIKKPINSIELVNVIKNVSQNLELERSLSLIKNVIGNVEPAREYVEKVDHQQQVQAIFSQLGIIGILGSSDLLRLIDKVLIYKKRHGDSSYKLQELYSEIAKENNEDDSLELSSKTIEQRIRRTIQKALSNIAALGLDDYSNPTFVDYSGLLFDFKQVNQEMNYIKDKTAYRGKINIKRFIEGIISNLD